MLVFHSPRVSGRNMSVPCTRYMTGWERRGEGEWRKKGLILMTEMLMVMMMMVMG